MTGVHSLIRDTALAAVAAAVSIGAVALGVRALEADAAARQLLAFGFAAPSRQPGRAVEIAAGNLRLAGTALLAAWVVQQRPAFRSVLDAALGGLAALNLALIGLALGAYGTHLLISVAAHGPLELGGFAGAGSAYLAARNRALTRRRLVVAGGISVALVSAAAVTETYVQLGADQ